MALRLSTGLVNAIMATSSLKAALEGGSGFLLDIYSGVQPANPDTAEAGTLLVTLSNGGAGTGIHFDTAVSATGVIPKAPGETWSGTAVGSGTAGWFRIHQVGEAGTASSTTAKRVDGSIATSGADLNLGALTILTGAPFLLNTAQLTLPTA